MKTILFFFFLLPISILAQSIPSNKILIVLSSYGKDLGKTRPGFEFDEYSQAYLIFKQNGFEIDVASPKGGIAEADGFNKGKGYNKSILEDSNAMNLLQNTKPTSALKADDYAAMYVVGGKGAMFDLPFDPSLQDLVSEMYQKNKIISAVCHGSAAFVNVKLKDGRYLIEDKKITGFCNEEENMFGKKWKGEFPFLLEDRLKFRKAFYEKSDVMLPQVSVSGNLLTGQNPFSTTALAEEIVKSLGKKPVNRSLYTDEASMILLKKAIMGEWDWAKSELSKNKANYDVELIGVYGYYRSKNAENDKTVLELSLKIMELVTPHYYNSTLQLEKSVCYKKLGDKAKARQLLEELVKKEPNLKEAQTLLSEL
jgi:putative intracellular protease/amidase